LPAAHQIPQHLLDPCRGLGIGTDDSRPDTVTSETCASHDVRFAPPAERIALAGDAFVGSGHGSHFMALVALPYTGADGPARVAMLNGGDSGSVGAAGLVARSGCGGTPLTRFDMTGQTIADRRVFRIGAPTQNFAALNPRECQNAVSLAASSSAAIRVEWSVCRSAFLGGRRGRPTVSVMDVGGVVAGWCMRASIPRPITGSLKSTRAH
jgi:hypothetical protein